MTTAPALAPWADLLAAIQAARDESRRRARSHRAKRRPRPAHDRMMAEYYAAREAHELRREAETRGYATEIAEWNALHPFTFRSWLEAYRSAA